MTYAIELRSLNSISVPNLVSIATTFLDPGVSARRSVPPPSRSNQPFGRYARKCTHRHTDSQTPAAQLFFTDPPEEIYVHKNVLCYALAPFILYDFGLEAGTAQKSFPPLARAAGTPQERDPKRILSWGGMGVTCEFNIGSAPRLTCRCVNVFLQAFSGRHVPGATCRQSTLDRHQYRSGVSGRRSKTPSRSNQPLGRYSPKCLDIYTD